MNRKPDSGQNQGRNPNEQSRTIDRVAARNARKTHFRHPGAVVCRLCESHPIGCRFSRPASPPPALAERMQTAHDGCSMITRSRLNHAAKGFVCVGAVYAEFCQLSSGGFATRSGPIDRIQLAPERIPERICPV
jgi:hypothetical protein